MPDNLDEIPPISPPIEILPLSYRKELVDYWSLLDYFNKYGKKIEHVIHFPNRCNSSDAKADQYLLIINDSNQV